MLKAQSSIMDFFLTFPTGIRVKHSKYGLISLELYVIKSFNLTQLIISEIQLLGRNSSPARLTHSNTSHEGLLGETQGEREGRKGVSYTKAGCTKPWWRQCSLQADLRGTTRSEVNAETEGYTFIITQSLWKKLGLTPRGLSRPFSLEAPSRRTLDLDLAVISI